MLKQLRISNLILIDQAEISFDKGLNVLTGETGAGKSSVMHALSLALGGRADSSVIRKGSVKAFVEADFQLGDHPAIAQLLESAELHHDFQDPLSIRRELSPNGKNRSFINDQVAPVALIEEIAAYLVDLVGQHSHQRLLSTHYHREVLDTFGKLRQLIQEHKNSWEQETTLKTQLNKLIEQTPSRLREIDTCEMELTELLEANLKEGEEEELFQEYSRLSHADEICSKVAEVVFVLSEGKNPVIPLLHRQKLTLEQAVALDASLEQALQTIQNVLVELDDACYSLSRYKDKLEADPLKQAQLNERITLINRLKKKYGNTLEEVAAYRAHLEKKLLELQQTNDQIPLLEEALEKLHKKGLSLCAELSKQRKAAAAALEKLITQQIKSLNMPKASFHIQLSEQSRNASGADKIEFCFSPNVGEQTIPLKECASGGELSRILLAIKTVLAGTDQVPTLIFDEIDANLGGETASIVGERLSQIAGQYQVLCITHLPQVASHGEHHFQICKEEKEGRTFARISKLDKAARQHEITRMLGGLSFSSATKELAEKILQEE